LKEIPIKKIEKAPTKTYTYQPNLGTIRPKIYFEEVEVKNIEKHVVRM
jgi:hypothetical protein